jgi:hypothetical protein
MFLLFANSVSAEQMPQDTTVLRIDPDDALGGTSGEMFKDIAYIPLENTPASVVGEISKLEVVKKYFIILDRSMDQVLIFNTDGSFHARCEKIPGLVKNAGMVNNFNFNVFGDFAIQRDKQQIVVRSNLDRENLFVFNYDGGFAEKIPLPKKNNGTRFWGYAFLNNKTSIYAVSHASFQQDSTGTSANELYLSNNFSTNFKREIKYDQNNIAKGSDIEVNLSGPFYYSGIKSSCFFTRPYDYNIYMIDPDGISKVYKVLLPLSYSVPTDFLVNEEKYRSKRREYLNKNNQLVYVFSNVYSLDNNLIFTINNHKYSDHKIFSYNLKTGSVFSLLNVSSDSSSFFLPLINKNSSVQACDGQFIYSSFSSLELFDVIEATKDRYPNYPPSLKTYFAAQNRKSNSVIVKLTPKTNM